MVSLLLVLLVSLAVYFLRSSGFVSSIRGEPRSEVLPDVFGILFADS